MRVNRFLVVWLVVSTLSLKATAFVESVQVSSRAELIRAVQHAAPGTTIQIASGEYAGELKNPIILEAADAENPPAPFAWRPEVKVSLNPKGSRAKPPRRKEYSFRSFLLCVFAALRESWTDGE